MTIKLTDLQIDALREVGNVAAGNAATGLSKLLNKKIYITTPRAVLLDIEKVPELLGGPESQVVAVYFQAAGDISASLLLIFEMKEALLMADILLDRKKGDTKMLDEYAQSALKELGNIATGSYLMAMSEFVGMNMMNSVPFMATDMLQAVLDGILASLAMEAENALVMETEFSSEEEKINGHLLFLPASDTLNVIIGKMGV